ncbi:MAG: glycine/D-amino acid oxidase-like deaminating enzyme [Gammaproteobacteria bacterium]
MIKVNGQDISWRGNSMNWTPLEHSLWAVTAPSGDEHAPLCERVESDVAIIGGGYCGLSSALHLAKQGLSVTVLEANEPGFGGSGRNNGHCVPEWLWQSPQWVVERYGAEQGERMNNFQASAAALVFSIIRDYQIECEAVQSGMLKVSRAGPSVDLLRTRAQQWSQRGKAVQLLEAAQLQNYVASSSFVCGLLFEQGGHLNALAYCRGLAAAANKEGAKLYYRSPAAKITAGDGGWQIRTSNGAEVLAKTVLIATNAFRHRLWPGLDQAYIPVRALGTATDPFPEELRRKVLPGGHNMQELNAFGAPHVFFFFDADGRLVTGGPVGLGVNTTLKRVNATVAKRVLSDFPQLGQVKFTHRWEGLFDVSPSKTPGVHQLARQLYAAVGFSGRGIPTATALGREIANMIVADDPRAMAFPLTPLPRNWFGALKGALWHNLIVPARHYRFE